MWGGTEHRAGVHLIKWDKLCQPQINGGCGLRKLRSQNQAFLMKVAYDLIAKPGRLWVQVIRAKYGWDMRDLSHIKKKPSSHLWKNILVVWEDTKLGIKWNIGNGQTIKFWEDNWLGDLGPLKLLSLAPIEPDNLNENIASFVTPEGTWNKRKYEHLLPMSVNSQIAAIPAPKEDDGQPSCYWNLTNNGKFTVSSAYESLTKESWDETNIRWKLAWKWLGMQRVRSFLWLLLNNRLLTNSERMRRHLTQDDACYLCPSRIEDNNHVFRECNLAKECWLSVIDSQHQQEFLSKPFDKWISSNLQSANIEWKLIFGFICWKLWEARNKRIFLGETTRPEPLLLSVQALVQHNLRNQHTTDDNSAF